MRRRATTLFLTLALPAALAAQETVQAGQSVSLTQRARGRISIDTGSGGVTIR